MRDKENKCGGGGKSIMKYSDYFKQIDFTREKRRFLLLAAAVIVVYFVGWVIHADLRGMFYVAAYAVLFVLACLNAYASVKKLERGFNELALRVDRVEK